jgi:hypothetical protein
VCAGMTCLLWECVCAGMEVYLCMEAGAGMRVSVCVYPGLIARTAGQPPVFSSELEQSPRHTQLPTRTRFQVPGTCSTCCCGSRWILGSGASWALQDLDTALALSAGWVGSQP